MEKYLYQKKLREKKKDYVIYCLKDLETKGLLNGFIKEFCAEFGNKESTFRTLVNKYTNDKYKPSDVTVEKIHYILRLND